MELVDGQLISSATDLINHLECPHLTYLNIEIALALQHKQFSCKKKKPTPHREAVKPAFDCK